MMKNASTGFQSTGLAFLRIPEFFLFLQIMI